jgi:NTP pyrophosphatase (non-canonical NTP hydrolase)
MQILAVDWGYRCFGMDHIIDKRVRSLRCAEEAVELAQACEVDKETMLKLVEVVYSRPVGDPKQEIGGVLVTAAIMANVFEATAHDLMLKELRRVLDKNPKHFANRNHDKETLGLF